MDHSSEKSCPIHHTSDNRLLNPDNELVFPLYKRAILQYVTNENADKELFIYYEDKEISFDEPELFSFAENLIKQSHFIAKSALNWGENYTWERIAELLTQLIAEGILQYVDNYLDETPEALSECPSPLPPATCLKPRTWLESEDVTQELTGRTLELGYLELVIPIFRIAHIVLDAEGRQIGEANVFPKALRLDIPTSWRTCLYSGSRYLDERPMNITAMKSMRNYWSEMMVILLHVRTAYLERFPAVKEVGWTVGDVEAISTLVLALPTYLLVRSNNPVENGQLHPALSSVFRVTDGLRMVTHQMIFVPVGEPTVLPSRPVTTSEIYDYAERNYSFSSEHGVCAGPKVMIEEFLNVLINGAVTKAMEEIELDSTLKDALAELQPAFDYGFYGLQAHAVMFSIFPLMTRTYVELNNIVEHWQGNETETLRILKERLKDNVNILKTQTYHATEEMRVSREQAYKEIYNHCAKGLNLPFDEQNMLELFDTKPLQQHENIKEKLSLILKIQCGGVASVDNLCDCLMHFFVKTQAILQLANQIQQNINKLLSRENSKQPLNAKTIDIHNLLQPSKTKKLAYLLDEIEDIFKIETVITPEKIELHVESVA